MNPTLIRYLILFGYCCCSVFMAGLMLGQIKAPQLTFINFCVVIVAAIVFAASLFVGIAIGSNSQT